MANFEFKCLVQSNIPQCVITTYIHVPKHELFESKCADITHNYLGVNVLIQYTQYHLARV